MRKLFALALIAALLCAPAVASAAAAAKAGAKKAEVSKAKTEAKPTKDGVLGLAATYIKKCTPKLDDKSKATLDAIKTQLFMAKGTEKSVGDAIDAIVNQLTLDLARLRSFDGLTVASAMMVQTAPANPRTANLFGCVLHTADHLPDATVVLEYATSLKPKSNLLRLNLASAYIDAAKWEQAKKLADQVLLDDRECKAAHKILSYYYYHKGDMGRFREELFKAATFKGFVRKKTDKKRDQVAKEEGKATDSKETLEQKTRNLANQIPMTTADIIEDEFPAEAQQIRDKYCKLQPDEQMRLPKLPQCNTSSPEGYRTSLPIIESWVSAFGKSIEQLHWKQADAKYGIKKTDSEAAIKAKGEAAAAKEIQQQMQQAQQMLEYMKNLPAMKGADSQAKIKEAMKELQQAAGSKSVVKATGGKVTIKDKPVDMSAPPPGMDYGSELVIRNYQDYQTISHTYETYLQKYFKDFMADVTDIIKVYSAKMTEEDNLHAQIAAKLSQEHDQWANNGAPEGSPHSTTNADKACKQEDIDHRKRMNQIGQDFYQQWAGIAFPQYIQKVKPTLDAYWSTCMLYVRNMNDPKVMEREYTHVIGAYTVYSTKAISMIMGGEAFKYVGPTYEDELDLERQVAEAREEAKKKEPEFERANTKPDFDLSKWLEDHLVLEVSGEFLSLKITAKSIEFEAWAFGPGAGIKYDWAEQKLESYTGFGAKLKVGVNVGGLELGAEAKGDFIRKVAKWDFEKGTYSESYEAKGEVSAGAGLFKAAGELSVNTELEAKAAGKILMEGAGGLQDEVELK